MPLSPQKQVAGDRDGITAFQMDIKCEGLSISTLERAIEQAREGRLQILDKMLEACPSPRSELPASVPKVERMSVNPSDMIHSSARRSPTCCLPLHTTVPRHLPPRDPAGDLESG